MAPFLRYQPSHQTSTFADTHFTSINWRSVPFPFGQAVLKGEPVRPVSRSSSQLQGSPTCRPVWVVSASLQRPQVRLGRPAGEAPPHTCYIHTPDRAPHRRLSPPTVAGTPCCFFFAIVRFAQPGTIPPDALSSLVHVARDHHYRDRALLFSWWVSFPWNRRNASG